VILRPQANPIELRPQADVNEVTDVTKAKTVYQIAQGTTKDQTQGQRPQDAVLGEMAVKQQYNDQPDYGDKSQQESLVRKQTKCRASVLDMCQTQETGFWERFPERQM